MRCKIVTGEANVERSDIFLQILSPLRSRNRHNIASFRKDPGERELRRRALFLLRDLAQTFDDIQVALKILSLESWSG